MIEIHCTLGNWIRINATTLYKNILIVNIHRYSTCMYVCTYIRTYVCMYICTCMYVCMYVCTCMYVCMYICMYVSIYLHHLYIHVRCILYSTYNII